MNSNAKKTILISAALIGTMSYAASANTVKLQEMANELKNKAVMEKGQAILFARQKKLPIRKELPNGKVIEIQKVKGGIPYYYTTFNADAAVTTRANHLWNAPYDVTGDGYSRLGEWDGGGIRLSHQELTGRVTQKDSPSGTHWHSTHVAGTMIASGVEAQAKGMAPEATLDAYDWNSDDSEMANAAANGMEISNHSYGYITGWYGSGGWYGDASISQNESYRFGFYSNDSKSWDDIAYNAPYYLIVKAAGNDRNDNAPDPGTVHTHNGSGAYTDTHNDDGFDNGGFDTISDLGVSKNILTVGAVGDVSDYSSPSDAVMSSFSGWGPADDGRIKPDIVANGVSLYSSNDQSDDGYYWASGTSMASPNAAGTLALLQQYYQNRHDGNPMRSATLKALILHAADEAGNDPGPDYKFGWGLLNAKKAAEVIEKDEKQNVIDELTLADGGSYSRIIKLKGNNLPPLRATIVWTDPAGTPVAPALDPADKMLVNDLDIRIVKDGTTYYPWRLDRNNPDAAATRTGRNDVDNVEQVLIDAPATGNYTIVVNHTGALKDGNDQNFSMILSTVGYTRNDFNHDGKADILWGDDNFKFRIWYMDKTGKIGSKWVGKKTDWQVRAVADFDGDNYADILWQRYDGKFTIWLMNESGKKGTIWIGEKNGWSVEGTGDVDADGKADILWNDGNDNYEIWLMGENGRRDTVAIGDKSGWSVGGMDDFDGDGKADILWKNNNGKFTIWLMDENGKRGHIWIGKKTGWSVEGTGDLDGDGKADIYWDKGSDTFTIWMMDENGRKGTRWIGHKSGWSIQNVNDFDGDGKADILWKNNNGKFTIWLMDENGKRGYIWIGSKPWEVMPGRELGLM